MAEAVPYVRISGLFAQLPARALNIVGAEVADGTGAALRRANVRPPAIASFR